MLLVENVPQPEALIVSGDASAPECRLRMGPGSTCPRWHERHDESSAEVIIRNI